MEATRKWDGTTERRAGRQWSRRKTDKVPVVIEDERAGGVFVLIVGVSIGAVLTMFWAGLAWLLGG
jgi:hypothetical protein